MPSLDLLTKFLSSVEDTVYEVAALMIVKLVSLIRFYGDDSQKVKGLLAKMYQQQWESVQQSSELVWTILEALFFQISDNGDLQQFLLALQPGLSHFPTGINPDNLDATQAHSLLFAIKFIVLHSEPALGGALLTTKSNHPMLEELKESLVRPLFKFSIQSKWDKYAQWMAIDLLATILLRIPEDQAFLENGVSLFREIAYLESDSITSHTIAFMLDTQFISLISQKPSESEDISAPCNSQAETWNFVMSFLLGHPNQEVQDVCLYGITFLMFTIFYY
eukprot:TRINITY_DN16679_c0_g1_i1.p1 TRINITY_DN16679_c0_g1~~TRINITY_DN16679_c0_g1_i1.p1  ORF type:complete len:278 (+),score=35.16 TRINITY_DN16679_c0_g1_i1:123-956(+)